MSAWRISSPYSAVGVYLGGVNRSCAQTNLTATWVSSQVAAGWRLIPTYVGLQAPANNCGCSSMSPSPSSASAEGLAAADDAVAEAAALGMQAGNPIYYDMESYVLGATNSPAVLSFLSAWTARLHVDGYVSGVYSSGASGITDLVRQYGTAYAEPDDLWIADWNGQQTVVDPYVPGVEWSNHQRLHQYQGGHTEAYGGVSIDIDGDYLDGAVHAGTIPEPPVNGVTLDGYGDVHHFGSVASNTVGSPTWPGWLIARGVAVRSDHAGGYVLDGWGGVHPFGSAPALVTSAYWKGWDIARGIALASDDRGGYVLDGWGGVHAFGNAPAVTATAYWTGWDIAVGIVLRADNRSGWVLDGWGGLHPFAARGTAMPPLVSGPYWQGWNIARGVSLDGYGGGYILDGYGGVHPFGTAAPVVSTGYYPGADVGRSISIYGSLPVAGYWLDAHGGLHPIGEAAEAPSPAYLSGQYIFRGIAVTS
jgi:Domain of unknown function (DUF1906)